MAIFTLPAAEESEYFYLFYLYPHENLKKTHSHTGAHIAVRLEAHAVLCACDHNRFADRREIRADATELTGRHVDHTFVLRFLKIHILKYVGDTSK